MKEEKKERTYDDYVSVVLKAETRANKSMIRSFLVVKR